MFIWSLILGSAGAILGGILSTTEKGSEVNDKMNEALDLYDSKVSKHIPGDPSNLLDWNKD